MSLKDILVIVDNAKSCPSRLDVALRLAQEHDAHLTGLFVRAVSPLPNFVMTQLGPEVADVRSRWSRQAADEARDEFTNRTSGTAVPIEWREAEGGYLEQVLLHAKYADVVVISQHNSDSGTPDVETGLAEAVVLEAGRPVLVVPYAGQFKAVGQRVMVAWNGTREATRALNDALPILERARQVDVIAVNPHEGNGRGGHGQIPSADIALHLARHGVKANAQHIDARDIDVGSALLSRAADEGTDLLVMGAYGRSRMREMILGGATRHILAHMTVPTLMSH